MRNLMFLLVATLIFSGCSSSDSIPKQEKQYQEFLQKLSVKKASMNGAEYLAYLKKTLANKEDELEGLKGQLLYKERSYQFNESTEYEENNTAIPDTQKLGRQIDMKRVKHQMELVQSQIFHLKSVVSSYEQ